MRTLVLLLAACTAPTTSQLERAVEDGDDPATVTDDQLIAVAAGKQDLSYGRVTLHRSPSLRAAWAAIDEVAAGDEVWLDRTIDAGASWDQLGYTVVPFGWTGWRTLLFVEGGAQVRACGRAGGSAVACTGWLPACDQTCDGDAAPEYPRDERQEPLAFVWYRKIALHIDDNAGAVWATIEAALPGDEVWIDRDWDAVHVPWFPFSSDAGWDGKLGWTTVGDTALTARTPRFSFDDRPHGGAGVVRACGKAGVAELVQCTPWIHRGEWAPDPRTAATGWLRGGYDWSASKWRGNDAGVSFDHWWQSATAITSLLDTIDRTGDCGPWDLVNDAFEHARDSYQHELPSGDKRFNNRWYDDSMWWGLAWLRAYEVSGRVACGAGYLHREEFLPVAHAVWQYVHDAKLQTGPCAGVVPWVNQEQLNNDELPKVGWPQYVVIANSLYLELTAKLALAGFPLAGEATGFFETLRHLFVRDDRDLIEESLGTEDERCSFVVYPWSVWPANYGVLLRGMAALARLTGDASYLWDADDEAHRIIAGRGVAGIMHDHADLDETDALKPDPCNTVDDAYRSKGSFVRGLRELIDTDLTFGRYTPAFSELLRGQVDAMLANARSGWNDIGYLWQGPMRNSCEVALGTVTSALDALNAADGVP